MTSSGLLSRKEAAEYLGTTPGTLANWASTRKFDIPIVKVGSKAFYRQQDLDRWISSRVRYPILN